MMTEKMLTVINQDGEGQVAFLSGKSEYYISVFASVFGNSVYVTDIPKKDLIKVLQEILENTNGPTNTD